MGITKAERGQWVRDRTKQVRERILKEPWPGDVYFQQMENLVDCAIKKMAYYEFFLFKEIPLPFAHKKVDLWTDSLNNLLRIVEEAQKNPDKAEFYAEEACFLYDVCRQEADHRFTL
ncbi:MAG: hypothetical protein LBE35_04380 [Clostridiales bacterium]|jgi:hypothetical protein|nr:hypothetical protein [Clostridiales bacterium]